MKKLNVKDIFNINGGTDFLNNISTQSIQNSLTTSPTANLYLDQVTPDDIAVTPDDIAVTPDDIAYIYN